MRLVRAGNRTLFKFLPYDDSSIQLPSDQLIEKYAEYLRTANLTLLNVDMSKKPAFYWFKPLNGELWQEVRSLIKTEEIDEVEDTSVEELKLLHKKILDTCLAGVDNHPEATGVSDDGQLIVKEWVWKVGEPAPDGIHEAILHDNAIVQPVLQFIIAVSVLTDREKKA